MVAWAVWKHFPERLLIVGLLLAAGCGGSGSNSTPGSEEPSALPVEDDFSDCATGWSTDTDEFVSLSCTDGAYRVLIKNPGKPQSSRIFFSEGVPSLSVESDAAYQAGPKTAAYGVGCWTTREQGYIFAVTPGAAWAIIKWDNGTAPPQTVLAASESENAIPGFSDSNRIRGECVGGGGKPAGLALYVNEKKIGTAEDAAGPASFPGFGLSVFSTEAGADVRFDNFAAREP